MHVLIQDSWVEFLDRAETDDKKRIEIRRQLALAPATGQYFVRQADVTMLWAYLRALGPRRVLRKIRSRRAESNRNDAWLSVGVGTVDDEDVVFVITAARASVTRSVVAKGLYWPWPADRPLPEPGHFRAQPDARTLEDHELTALAPLVGWAPEMGELPVDSSVVDGILKLVCSDRPRGFVALPRSPLPNPPQERLEAKTPPGEVGFTCFAYGQYAKTQAIANLSKFVPLTCVHDIDPVQLGPVSELDEDLAWDSSPVPRPDEKIANAVLAGYHHNHAPNAVDLIDRGARHVIIEKPLAVSHDQLDDLLAAMAAHPEARVHAGFQRRHSPFNGRLLKDLGHGPVSMSATVYEVPLPDHHWYRWPVVGNSVVSNGCHWIDYFCFLNEFADVVQTTATAMPSHVTLGLELSNGASASISLRHAGSPRLGVRDLCTFWSGENTVTIEDNSRYVAENGYHRRRPVSCPRLQSHENMYVEFGRRISADAPGDSRRSIEVSTRAMLDLAALVDASTARRAAEGLDELDR